MFKFIISCFVVLLVSMHLKAQTDTFSTIVFPNTYTNKITSAFYAGNYRSGFVHESNGSINMGLTGIIAHNFRFRWLAHDTGTINYGSDVDQLMYLDGRANLYVKNSVAIGAINPDPATYKLLVEGTIGARRLKVMQNSWADFVFEPEYRLPALAEVEEYIKVNRHLPDVPSAKEVEKDGLDVGEMNKRLLQKVEELTLYLIEQQKQLKVQQEQIATLQDQNKAFLNQVKKGEPLREQ